MKFKLSLLALALFILLGCASKTKIDLQDKLIAISKMQPRDYDNYFNSFGYKWVGDMGTSKVYAPNENSVDTLTATSPEIFRIVNLESNIQISYVTYNLDEYLKTLDAVEKSGFKKVNDDLEKYLNALNSYTYEKDNIRMGFIKHDDSGKIRYEISANTPIK